LRRTCAALVGLLVCAATAASSASAAVHLSSPPDDASLESTPVFTWNSVKGADHYELQLAADSHFGSSVLGSSSNSLKTGNTAATLSKNLADGTYYWRVRSVNASGRAAGWSSTRSFVKAWTTAPTLIDPNDLFEVIWPTAPLRLHWSSVPGAVSYRVVVGTDPTLAAPVIGGPNSPVETQGTTLALPNALAPGRYYWAITPKDSDGHPGRQSSVGSFSWNWPSTTTTAVNDLNSDPRVFDPQFSWAAVPGAARYEVEVNPSDDWNPTAKVCCSDATIGNSLSPTKLLGTNTYLWRVRAIDAQGDVGQWNVGPSFHIDIDPVAPTIPNLRLRDNTTDPLPGPYPIATTNPVIQWDPVPGASSYEVQLLDWNGSCDELHPAVDRVVYGVAWTPLHAKPTSTDPGPSTWPSAHSTPGLDDGMYCVRVLAQRQNHNGFISNWTWIGGSATGVLNYAAPSPGVPSRPALKALPDDYLSALSPPTTPCAQPGSAPCTTRLPLFTWSPIPGAQGYYVIVARDPNFAQVVDYAYTASPAYAVQNSDQGGGDYTDETTHYYWAVMPYRSGDPTMTFDPTAQSPQEFDKRSIPPTPIGPAEGSDVSAQPVFNWTGAEGARTYRLQVATDPNFGDVLDDVKTDSTAYTSSATYPVDTILYWRVRAIDGRDVGLNWSHTATFRRRLPAPAPLDSNPTSGADIPALGWSSVSGALSYGVHVDYPNGTTKDFTVYSTLFTPTEFYGNGVWHWKVRANFPNGSGTSSVGGAYSQSVAYTRLLPAPTGGLATRTSKRVLVTWDPDSHAYKYHLQTSLDSSFDSTVENVTTRIPAYAPTLNSNGYKTGGKIYWRIASQDKGNNQGAFAGGTFVLPRGFRIRTRGFAHKGARNSLAVSLTDATGKPIKGAKVTLSGAGIKKVTNRVNKRGEARFVVRPKRRGTITVRVRKSGYRDGLATFKVR
jgi:hypothetical protein